MELYLLKELDFGKLGKNVMIAGII